VATLLQCDAAHVLKTLLFTDGQRTFAAVVRGDHAVNPLKLAKALGVGELELAPDWLVEQTTNAPVGFAGPIGLRGGISGHVMVVADNAVLASESVVVGANKADTHLLGVTPSVDFAIDLAADIRMAVDGDVCPRCGEGRLRVSRGIEVGHIFKLGTKYSKALGATFLDAAGQEQPMVMGCYGIGISRTMAAAVEQLADADGMVWPIAIAPYHVVVVPVNAKDPEQSAAAEELYAALTAAGIEAVLDDRDERPGVKFKDADLVGFPIRVTLGAKALAQGCAEVKLRQAKEPELVELALVVAHVAALLQRAR
jgi:prolyl-tRNA synthetase